MPTWLRTGLLCLFVGTVVFLARPPYQLKPILGGRAIVRLNTWTGAVDLCLPNGETLECHPELKDPWAIVDQAPIEP